MKIKGFLSKLKNSLNAGSEQCRHFEEQKILLAKLLVQQLKNKTDVKLLEEVEFKVFSQWGDDGIIQWLINNLHIPHKTFIEFGVGDYSESNTRFLMMNNNWSGLIMDGSSENMNQVKKADYYWRYDLEAKAAFIDRDNINTLIMSRNFDPEIGILHIDIDGNDYWIWDAIDCVSPVIVIMEYNSVFGKDRALTVPYEKSFSRTDAHHSHLYFGASLKALNHLACKKGYALIGSCSAGVNAYFVRKDKLNSVVKEVDLETGYVLSKARESRDTKGNLTFVTGDNRLQKIKGLPVHNVEKDTIESL